MGSDNTDRADSCRFLRQDQLSPLREVALVQEFRSNADPLLHVVLDAL
jgi:hypothetical protein